jgi:hypothetical protein
VGIDPASPTYRGIAGPDLAEPPLTGPLPARFAADPPLFVQVECHNGQIFQPDTRSDLSGARWASFE